MTHEEIIAMAREEGLSFVPDTNSPLARIVRKAVAKEREACAQVCEEVAREYEERHRGCYPDDIVPAEMGADACAAAIRARGQKEGA